MMLYVYKDIFRRLDGYIKGFTEFEGIMNKKNSLLGEIPAPKETILKKWSELQYGMFIHLGLYSKLGGVWNGKPVTKGYSEQIQMWANISQEKYETITQEFTLEEFDAKAIVSLAKKAGMKYIVVTSKHHDGFCLFDTKTTDYNIVKSTPFEKDLLKLLSDECQRQGIKFGIYFSLIDWHLGHEFDHNNNNLIPSAMETVIKEQLTELMTNYGEIVEVWFDMSQPTPKQSEAFSEIVRKYQPLAAINGRIWNNEGDFRTLGDNQIPTEILEGIWQTPASIYHETWGYREWQERKNPSEKARKLLESFISVRARNGNYLLNIGPKGNGEIVEFESNVLEIIGEWLTRHPHAVIGANATRFAQHSWGEITVNNKDLYLHIFKKPEDNKVILWGLDSEIISVQEDSGEKMLDWFTEEGKLIITLPENPTDNFLTTLKVELAEELFILPDPLVESANGKWRITSKDITKAYNFVDEGHYYSLEKTNVKQIAYFQSVKDKQVYLTFTGKANAELNYSIQIGKQKIIVSGKQLLSEKIGSFSLGKEDKILSLTIELHEPKNKYQDMELITEEIILSS